MATQTIANDSPLVRTVQQLERCLGDGDVRIGDRLPAEQKLAERFKVSRGTVRSALRRLETRGLIRGRRNRGYVVLPAAVSGQTVLGQTIALATDIPGRLRREFFSGDLGALKSGVADGISDAGRNCLVLHPDFIAGPNIDRLADHPPAGLIVSCLNPGFPDAATISRLADMAIPLVIHNDFRDVPGLDSVQSDHAQGCYDLTRWLIGQGRRRILRLWSVIKPTYWLTQRNAGFERAIREADLELLPPVIMTGMPHRVEGSREVFDQRVRYFAGYLAEHLTGPSPADAILLVTDCEVFPASAACRLFGRDPQRDLLVTGYDNYWQHAFERQWEPAVPAATVDKHNHLIGQTLVDLLLQRLDGKLPHEAQRRTVSQRLVIPDPASADLPSPGMQGPLT